MTESTDNSSLPLLLSITGAVVAVALGGWYFLYQESSTPVAVAQPGVAPPQTTITAGVAADPAPHAEQNSEGATVTEGAVVRDAQAAPDVDAELRKARLAADADILILPASQSALYYYGRVLEADPQHAVANAERDAILVRIEQVTMQHLAAEEYESAYDIAALVSAQSPEHSLVLETQRVLDQKAEQLVAEAIQHVQAGEDEQGDLAVAAAQALPGRNPDYFDAIRESIADIREVRLDAERDRAQRAQLARNEARAAWIKRVRQATAAGNLISPAGASARDLLAERNSWQAEREQLNGELLAAIAVAAKSSIGAGSLEEAEALLNAAAEISGNPDENRPLRASLENALIQRESTRVAHMKELVQVKSSSPRYPRRAMERGVSGWVDIYFTVTPNGETAEISVNQSEPRSVFDRAAIEAVEKWAFQPVEFRGRLINQRAAARLVFRLE